MLQVKPIVKELDRVEAKQYKETDGIGSDYPY